MKYRVTSICFGFLFFFSTGAITAQKLSRLAIDFIREGQQLANPLAGGLNAPQFNEVDLNNDGILDLFIFDRTGDMCLPYLNEGTANQVSYTFAPQFCFNFPALHDWVALRDFDGDGIMDIFTESSVPGVQGIEVFKGRYSNGKIAFQKLKTPLGPFDILYFKQTNGGITQINVARVDYPGIEDMDGDGDLDILTFNVAGGYIEYFQNESVEMGYGRDSLYYTIADNCWGKLFESGVSGCIDLSDNPNSCYTPFTGGGVGANYRHPGSTLLLLDIDDDDDQDLLLGDISFENVVLAINGGTTQSAWVTDQDCDFPSYDVPVELNIYPACYYVDVDNDSQKDLLVSPNIDNNEDFDCVWFYKNVSEGPAPEFERQKTNLFVDNMLDMGTGAQPVFVDYDADGLLDLVVGNGKFYQPFGDEDPRLFLYRNIGTAEAPKFELIDDDWLGFSQLVGGTNFNLAPTFGDLDNDGDLDLLVGEESGKLFFAQNNAGLGQPLLFGTVQFNYMGIDVTQLSTPCIVDVNRDGLMDLLIGQRGENVLDPNDPYSVRGNINYYQNIGTTGDPMFDPVASAAPNSNMLGFVSTLDPPLTTGHSAPVMIDFNGQYKLFSGSTSGKIKLYSNIDGNLTGTFNEENDDYGEIVAGIETRPAIADINNDGVYDMIVGNKRGGLVAYITTFNTDGTSSNGSVDLDKLIQIAPNPALDRLRIELPENGALDASYRIFGLSGQQLINGQTQGVQTTIDISSLTPGVYFVEVILDARVYVEKLVVGQ